MSRKVEIIPGHRRKRASDKADIEKMPAVVAKLNDDEATSQLADGKRSCCYIIIHQIMKNFKRTDKIFGKIDIHF